MVVGDEWVARSQFLPKHVGDDGRREVIADQVQH
jgi:hypothetical protein